MVQISYNNKNDNTNLITDCNSRHSSGTYDKMTRTGGSSLGTIRFKEELSHGANAGLDLAISWLEPIHASFPSLSYADLYTLAGGY